MFDFTCNTTQKKKRILSQKTPSVSWWPTNLTLPSPFPTPPVSTTHFEKRNLIEILSQAELNYRKVYSEYRDLLRCEKKNGILFTEDVRIEMFLMKVEDLKDFFPASIPRFSELRNEEKSIKI